ncbi:MAG: B12-binding domain-containing radical SAM protein, partial [Armatimonadetes bacterium]|nr:B12-binding domain-containing radical SAM protein [Armatimonadota bacterium]
MLPDDLLMNVETPARYIDHEWNACRKRHAEVRLRIALCYPDAYQVGMDHLGLLILYHLANELPGVSAERCFAPWPDAAEEMRRRGWPLATLETGTPLAECDLVGFTLQYELTYPTILEMLRLGRVPVRAAERSGAAPIVIAGGPGATNPEPLAPFIDLFCVGDGEEL